MKDWSKVEVYWMSFAESDERVVLETDFDSLLTELRETRRALEMSNSDDWVGGRTSESRTVEDWLSEARTELAKETP